MTKTNPPAMAFGSKEWNAYYGLRHGSRKTNDRAARTRKGMQHALTKKGEAEHHERIRKDVEAEGAKLAKAQQAEDRAEARILGPSGRTHAVKVSHPSGTFGPDDVQAFLQAGWQVHPAGSVSAKTGLSLGAIAPWDVAMNPSSDLSKLLGPQLAARALVLAHPDAVVTSDTLHALRRAGYDVAAAPKGLREGRGLKVNPGHLAPGADTRSPKKREPGTMTKTPAPSRTAAASLLEVEQMMAFTLSRQVRGKVEVCSRGEDRWTIHGKPKAVEKAVTFLESRGLMVLESKEHDDELGETFAYLRSGATKANPTKTGRGASPTSGKGVTQKPHTETPRPEPSKVHHLKSPKADRYRAEQGLVAILEKGMAKAKPKASKPPQPKVESATVKLSFNPGSAKDVERVWKAWTGAEPGQVLKLSVSDPTGSLPSNVALLGRISRLIQPDGHLKDFGSAGPLMVTDGHAKQVWLVHPKGLRFSLLPSVICYLAKKPKFGDKGLVEYVHRFDRPAKAQMDGQVGTLTGGFHLTPRGIEG